MKHLISCIILGTFSILPAMDKNEKQPTQDDKDYKILFAQLDKRLQRFESDKFLEKIADAAEELQMAFVAYSDNYFECFVTSYSDTTQELSRLAHEANRVMHKDSLCSNTQLITQLTLRDKIDPSLLELAIKSIPEIKMRYYITETGTPSFNQPPLPTDNLKKDHTSNYKKRMLELLENYKNY